MKEKDEDKGKLKQVTQKDMMVRFSKWGDVLESKIIEDDEVMEARKQKKERTPQQIHFINQQNKFKEHCSNLGGYIHMIYLKNKTLFNETKIDKANISRLIFLATYLSYNSEVEGLLVKKGQNFKNIPLTRKDIKQLLGLSDRAFTKFLKDVKSNELLYEVDKLFYLNTSYFNKGAVENVFLSDDKSYCRLFIDVIRNLYNGTDCRKHKLLSNIFCLIPFIHYEHNTICHNPNEHCDSPNSMTSKEICDILGIGNDRSQRSKFIRSLYEFKINTHDQDIRMFTYVEINENYNYFVVNPLLVYSGNNYETMVNTAKTFFFNDNTHSN